MSDEELDLITRREAVKRVSFLLGGVVLVGGSGLLTACAKDTPERREAAGNGVGQFTAQDVALLDEVADTILPTTSTPGAKAARTGAFMALMVTDTYTPRDQQVFRDGMRTLDDASRKMHNAAFMQATPQQRLALLETLDREAKAHADRAGRAAPAAAQKDTGKTGEEFLPDQRKEQAKSAPDANPAPAITEKPPAHYFRMMKELAMLGYFTSEIGYTQAQRYVESPGRFDPCVPYTKGEKSWAPHA